MGRSTPNNQIRGSKLLFLAKLKWRDGESEYESFKGFAAEDLNAAFLKAQSHLSKMWGDESIREDGYFMAGCGYPAVKVDSITKIRDMSGFLRGVDMPDAEGRALTMKH